MNVKRGWIPLRKPFDKILRQHGNTTKRYYLWYKKITVTIVGWLEGNVHNITVFYIVSTGQHLGTCQANHTTVYILMANLRIMCIDGICHHLVICNLVTRYKIGELCIMHYKQWTMYNALQAVNHISLIKGMCIHTQWYKTLFSTIYIKPKPCPRVLMTSCITAYCMINSIHSLHEPLFTWILYYMNLLKE